MLKLICSLVTSGGLLAAAAAPASIGTVKSTGAYRVNGSAVPGNNTLFEGDVVETATARSVVNLGATQITLLPSSRAHIFHDRTILEKGSGLLTGAPDHAVEAASLRIVPVERSSVVQVEISSPNHVSVAARQGSAEVRNSSGVLLASLRTGLALAFEPQGGASAAVKTTGTVTTESGRYYVTDASTNVKVELQGQNLSQFVGKMVTVEGASIPGAAAAGGASQVVQVVHIATVHPPSPTGAPSGGGGGLSHGATIAIIGGVAVAGTLIGLGAAGTFSGSDHPTSVQ